jgi:hypothetical protein
VWVGTACGALSPIEGRNTGGMHRELAEEVVVVVKRHADEDMVTYQRVAHAESAKESGDEGRNMLMGLVSNKSYDHEVS